LHRESLSNQTLTLLRPRSKNVFIQLTTTMSATFFLKSAAAAAVGCVAEKKYASNLGINDEAMFMVTPTILLGVGFWTFVHGMTVVGPARGKYMELAKKDGEKDVEERYGLPNLYAQGTSKNVRAFNCIQRSHQHIFETYTLVAMGGVIGSYTFPIVSAMSTMMYAVGRYALSKGYAESDGDAAKRYSSPFALCMWYGLLMNCMVGFASSAAVISGKKLK
jgi:hypothetical protein